MSHFVTSQLAIYHVPGAFNPFCLLVDSLSGCFDLFCIYLFCCCFALLSFVLFFKIGLFFSLSNSHNCLETLFVDQDSLTLREICLPLSPKCEDQRHAPPHLAAFVFSRPLVHTDCSNKTPAVGKFINIEMCFV